MGRILQCPVCQKEFSTNGHRIKYCSFSCARKADVGNTIKRIDDTNRKNKLAYSVYERYNFSCAICKWQATPDIITVNNQKQVARGNEIHHITAVKDGGEAKEDNLILLCPNHHKQADLGILTKDELRKYLILYSDKDVEDMKNNSIDRIAESIFC